MRIAFDVSPLATQRSGVGNYTLNLLKHLTDGYDDEIVPIRHQHMNKTLWMQTVLRGELRRIQPDVVHFTNAVAPLWLGLPFVLTIHDMTLWSRAEQHPLKRRLAMRPIMPYAARQAAAIITPSESVRQQVIVRLRVLPERVYAIYEAAGNHFAVPPSTRTISEPFILFVGTLEPRKNLGRLLEAYARIRQEIPHRLIIAGAAGWMYEPIIAKIDALQLGDCVHMMGYVPDEILCDLMYHADVLVYPSLEEGFGLPIIEAMKAGTPVITSNVGAMAEVAADAAHLVDPYNVGSIAHGLRAVLQDAPYAQTLRERGCARAADFSWRRTAQQTHNVYTQVLQYD